jgi:hypothetical protein
MRFESAAPLIRASRTNGGAPQPRMLPSIKLGRHRRFVRTDVEAALAKLRRGVAG